MHSTTINNSDIPGADHILAQPVKRCRASRIKPNETFELAKKRKKNIIHFGVCGRKNFFMSSPSCKQSPKSGEKSLCPTVLALKWVISTWWDGNMTLLVFSACYEIHWNWFCGRKQTKNAKIRKGAFFSQKSVLIGRIIFQVQRINAVHGRCSSSGVLRHISSNCTRRMPVCPTRKRKPSILSLSNKLNRFNRLSRRRTAPFKSCAKIWSAPGIIKIETDQALLE